ncbi:hypothetical protein NAPIS_ORF02481 [Vairimorpha apis BRL 01]|uniref:Uncharacterized protein n=1 Tax=Vairimorpha apis BRL 01 TaxID=1037528 RepID=T0L5M5_9MICR|nr:hypothetical protein NAPIS_ORF02481 [Vairimorpha apis BRL 01]
MGNFCSCLDIPKRKLIISVIGLEEDVQIVLKTILPYYVSNPLPKFSEHSLVKGRYKIIIHAHIITPLIKSLIKLHFPVESAVIYSIDADNPTSIDHARMLMDEQHIKNDDSVTILCRGKYLENPVLQEIKDEISGGFHSHLQFVKFEVNEANKYISKAFDKILERLMI